MSSSFIRSVRPHVVPVLHAKKTESALQWKERVCSEYGIHKPDDWYEIKPIHLKQINAHRFLDENHKGSLLSALKVLYPDHLWQIWRFSQLPAGIWNDISHHSHLFDFLKQKLNIKSPEDWYAVDAESLKKYGASSLLKEKYRDSLAIALLSLYPDIDWKVSRFRKTQRKFWEDIQNQRKVFDWVSYKLDIQTTEDWYDQKTFMMAHKKLFWLLKQHHRHSLASALVKIFPDYKWQLWRFAKRPLDMWKDAQVQRDFLDWFEDEMKMEGLEDWYKITPSMLRRARASGLLNQHGGSLLQTLHSVYPDFVWQQWKFAVEVSPAQKAKHRKFFDSLACKLGIQDDLDNWYKVDVSQVRKTGARILQSYGNSLIRAIAHVYSEHPWQLWRFEQAPTGFWDDEGNVKKYMDWLSDKLSIKKTEDWYQVGYHDMELLKGRYVASLHGGLVGLLKKAYPETSWDESRLLTLQLQKSQSLLARTARELFPDDVMHINYRNPDMQYGNNQRMELDIYIPSFSIAFEYQGEQHYQDVTFFGVERGTDGEKKETCRVLGITLIEVPYRWDRTKESLAATIRLHRPELLLQHSSSSCLPIPLIPPDIDTTYASSLNAASNWTF